MFTIHLISWGSASAKPAGEVKIGDVITFNYGHQYTVTGRRLCGDKSVNIDMVSNNPNAAGEHFRASQRFLKSRLVAAETPQAPAVKRVQVTLREVPSVSDFERAATAEFKNMLGDKVRQARAAGATEEEAIKAVRALWLQAISESA
jgi:hypothetical protein